MRPNIFKSMSGSLWRKVARPCFRPCSPAFDRHLIFTTFPYISQIGQKCKNPARRIASRITRVNQPWEMNDNTRRVTSVSFADSEHNENFFGKAWKDRPTSRKVRSVLVVLITRLSVTCDGWWKGISLHFFGALSRDYRATRAFLTGVALSRFTQTSYRRLLKYVAGLSATSPWLTRVFLSIKS